MTTEISATEAQGRVLEFLRADADANGGTTTASLRRIGQSTGIAPGTVWSLLQKLEACGLTERVGARGRSTEWRIPSDCIR